MYKAKFAEVSLKFNSFVADVSQDIEHGKFYSNLRLDYGIDVGTGEKVQLQDLLQWINSSVRPRETEASGGRVSPSGFFSTVMQQPDEPSLLVTRDHDSANDKEHEQGLASFLCSTSSANSSAVNVDQVFAPSCIKRTQRLIVFLPSDISPTVCARNVA